MKKNVYYNPSVKDLQPRWYLLDAKGQTVGKVAARVARILMGKHEATYVPHLDNGHRVVVINAAHVLADPKKTEQKIYWHHTGYPGGIRQQTMAELLQKRPTEVIRRAVEGMLPKTRSGRLMLGKLYVYAEDQHEQVGQKPEVISV